MALDESGQLIDPYQGQRDLRERVLRHVGPAFVEDPVRILRLARFAARFADFSIAPETMELARSMVASGEADALVPERVWQEIALGLMEEQPARMVEVLAQTGLLERLAPDLTVSPHLLAALDRAAQRGASLSARFAVLCSGATSSPALQAWLERLRADSESLQLARLLFELHEALRNARSADEQASVLERADALRRGARFEQLLLAFEALQGGDARRWRVAAAAAGAVDAGAIAATAGPNPTDIAQAVAAARRQAIAAARDDGGGPRA
jgi:tRNA nucleotidyltransferase (CCA-adding enzyme)